MTTDTQNHQDICGLLENAQHQVEATQSQVTAIEGQMQEIKSQIDRSLEAITSVLKQLETREQQADRLHSDMAAKLGEMFEQMTRIVNGARDQMLHHPAGKSTAQDTAQDVAEMPVEQAPVEQIPVESPTEQAPAESLTGPEAGQRATASLNEMIATIDETKVSETKVLESSEKTQTPLEVVPEISTVTQPEPAPETDEINGPGSADSLSTLLAKARAASSGEMNEAATELPPLVDEEEDAQTVSELLKNTSGSFVAQ